MLLSLLNNETNIFFYNIAKKPIEPLSHLPKKILNNMEIK